MGIPGRRADPAVIAEYQRLRRAGATKSQASRATGLAWNTCTAHDPEDLPMGRITRVARSLARKTPEERSAILRASQSSGIPDASPAGKPAMVREEETDESKDTRTLSFVTDRPIRTLQDAIDAAEVDLDTWVVEKWEVSHWTVPMKLSGGKGEPDEPVQAQQYRVKVVLRRIAPKPVLDALRSVFDRMKEHAPRYPSVISRSRPKDPHLLEIDLFDHHFGKLAWGRETGQDYDLSIAERLWRDAIGELLGKASGYEVEEVLFPIGNDLLNVDNAKNTTTAGTPQEVDGRLCKVIEVAKMSLVWAVEEMAARADRVRVVVVPGNHDHLLSFCLGHMVDAWFHNASHVEVDTSPRRRKRVRYGVNLIGFTHGDMRNIKGLPTLMASEWPEDWAATTFREWHLGHLHTERKFLTQPVETVDGVVIRYLRSLCGTDAWHYGEGYAGSPRAAECYLWGRDRGPTGMFYAYAE